MLGSSLAARGIKGASKQIGLSLIEEMVDPLRWDRLRFRSDRDSTIGVRPKHLDYRKGRSRFFARKLDERPVPIDVASENKLVGWRRVCHRQSPCERPNGSRLSCGASAGGRKRAALRYEHVGAQTDASSERRLRQLQALVRQHPGHSIANELDVMMRAPAEGITNE